MISSEVQRTLVKSPPELWAELSDPAALARHLGELGEIRITRAQPERRIEWESEGTSGTVQIKPSGWGTKVTLSVTRELEALAQEHEHEQDAAAVELVHEAESEVAAITPAEPEAPAAEQEPDAPVSIVPAETSEPDLASETTSEPEPAPAPRRGFFARLFGRRQQRVAEPAEVVIEYSPPDPSPDSFEQEAQQTSAPELPPRPAGTAIESLQARFQPEPPAEAGAESAPEEPATEPPPPASTDSEGGVLEQARETAGDASSPPPADLAAELKAAEEVAAEEVKAVLTAVLDRLGAAHHRPFSRA